MLNKDTCLLYELFAASWNGGRPTAVRARYSISRRTRCGRRRGRAPTRPVYRSGRACFATTKFVRGVVDHAIRFTAQTHRPEASSGPRGTRPALRATRRCQPMGARFRLRSDFSFAGYGAQTQVVLLAMQRYGLILADNGSNWFFQGSVDARWPDQLISEVGWLCPGASASRPRAEPVVPARRAGVGSTISRGRVDRFERASRMRFSSEISWSGQRASTLPWKNQFDPLSARIKPLALHREPARPASERRIQRS